MSQCDEDAGCSLKREPPAVYQGKFEPRVLYKAFMALHDL
jgi:oleate hydratase